MFCGLLVVGMACFILALLCIETENYKYCMDKDSAKVMGYFGSAVLMCYCLFCICLHECGKEEEKVKTNVIYVQIEKDTRPAGEPAIYSSNVTPA